MKNLRNVKDREEIARRMGNVRADSPRLWGKMSAHQMICHMSDGFRLYMGERKADAVGGIYPSRVMRWFALWASMRWPKGFQTMKELDQRGGGGTSPVDSHPTCASCRRYWSASRSSRGILPGARTRTSGL
jgi:hypothetical protein